MLALHRALAAGASVEVLLAMFDAAFLADLPESVDALHEIRQREPALGHHFVAELR